MHHHKKQACHGEECEEYESLNLESRKKEAKQCITDQSRDNEDRGHCVLLHSVLPILSGIVLT
jgi:hypothetical protein